MGFIAVSFSMKGWKETGISRSTVSPPRKFLLTNSGLSSEKIRAGPQGMIQGSEQGTDQSAPFDRSGREVVQLEESISSLVPHLASFPWQLGVREMDQDHSLVKKLNISIDLVVYNTIIIDEIRVLNTNIETIKT